MSPQGREGTFAAAEVARKHREARSGVALAKGVLDTTAVALSPIPGTEGVVAPKGNKIRSLKDTAIGSTAAKAAALTLLLRKPGVARSIGDAVKTGAATGGMAGGLRASWTGGGAKLLGQTYVAGQAGGGLGYAAAQRKFKEARKSTTKKSLAKADTEAPRKVSTETERRRGAAILGGGLATAAVGEYASGNYNMRHGGHTGLKNLGTEDVATHRQYVATPNDPHWHSHNLNLGRAEGQIMAEKRVIRHLTRGVATANTGRLAGYGAAATGAAMIAAANRRARRKFSKASDNDDLSPSALKGAGGTAAVGGVGLRQYYARKARTEGARAALADALHAKTQHMDKLTPAAQQRRYGFHEARARQARHFQNVFAGSSKTAAGIAGVGAAALAAGIYGQHMQDIGRRAPRQRLAKGERLDDARLRARVAFRSAREGAGRNLSTFDSERDRHRRQDIYGGVAAGGAVAAGASAMHSRRTGRALQGSAEGELKQALAGHVGLQHQIHRMAQPTATPGSLARTGENFAHAAKLHREALAHGAQNTELHQQARRSFRAARGKGLVGVGLAGAAYGIQRHDRKGGGRNYSYVR